MIPRKTITAARAGGQHVTAKGGIETPEESKVARPTSKRANVQAAVMSNETETLDVYINNNPNVYQLNSPIQESDYHHKI